jgi:parallel beta-helix repeat protein
VTIKGFTVTETVSAGIFVARSSHIVLSGNRVSYSGRPVQGKGDSGIYLTGTQDSLVAHNAVFHNTDAGIELTSGSTGDEVRANTVFANAQGWQREAAGIRLYTAPGNLVDRNASFDNEDSGIESFDNSNGSRVVENVVYGNGDHGIDDNGCTGQEITDNTVYNNLTAGINLEAGATRTLVANNITVNNGVTSPRTHSNIRVDAGSTAGTRLDYDLVFSDGPHALLIWNSIPYGTLSSFQVATGQEQHGIQADPKWVSTDPPNFHLTAGSPAIDSADSLVPHQPSSDIQGHPRADDPATPNTGTGPRTYDDRGAYEYQP